MGDIFDKCFNYTRSREAKAIGLYPYFKAIASAPGPVVYIDGKKLIMIGSNNYLGLTSHPKVKEAAIKAIEKYGTSCTGSRFLNGTLVLHEELESKLAEFFRKPACLVFSTGFQTNLGIVSTIVGKDDIVVIDKESHASVYDACRLSFGKVLKYKHNDMADLERVLINAMNDISTSNRKGGVLIITDGVFSMEGDIADVPKLVELKKKYNARLMIDDAHGIGVMGKNGRGVAEHFGLEDEVDIVMGTFSKSFASLGGFVVADERVIDYIKHTARALIFSASIPPAQAAAALASLEVIKQEPQRRERLWKNTHKMLEGFKKLNLNTGNSQSPVIPIIIGDDTKTFIFWKLLFEKGVFVNPVISPAVAPERALLRTSYMATHSPSDLDTVLEVFEDILKNNLVESALRQKQGIGN